MTEDMPLRIIKNVLNSYRKGLSMRKVAVRHHVSLRKVRWIVNNPHQAQWQSQLGEDYRKLENTLAEIRVKEKKLRMSIAGSENMERQRVRKGKEKTVAEQIEVDRMQSMTRCPECGGMVKMPCELCKMKRIRDRCVRWTATLTDYIGQPTKGRRR